MKSRLESADEYRVAEGIHERMREPGHKEVAAAAPGDRKRHTDRIGDRDQPGAEHRQVPPTQEQRDVPHPPEGRNPKGGQKPAPIAGVVYVRVKRPAKRDLFQHENHRDVQEQVSEA